MNNSSDDFLNNITITGTGSSGSSDTITIDLGDIMTSSVTVPNNFYYSSMSDLSTVTLTTGSSSNAVLSSGDITTYSNIFQWRDSIPFENNFPEWEDFQNMMKEYPGLEKTFENLKACYDLCKDDWESKKRGSDV